jgi:hypothetical protein
MRAVHRSEDDQAGDLLALPRRPRSDLCEQPDVVATGPVLDHLATSDPAAVDVGPRDWLVGNRHAGQKRARRLTQESEYSRSSM